MKTAANTSVTAKGISADTTKNTTEKTPRRVDYASFDEAFMAALSCMERGVKCKGIGPKSLLIYE